MVAFGATDNTSPGGYLNKPAELMNTIDPFGDTDSPTGDDAQNVAEGSDGSY